jgi:hypothetical protein
MNKGGFSWKRFLSLSQARARISRKIGIPLTESGREPNLGAIMGFSVPALVLVMLVVVEILLWVR